MLGNQKKNILGIIIARKGSKGIKNKNLRIFCKKPLVYWTISEAKKSRYLDEILLSTDSKKIAQIGKKNKISVPFLRPSRLSNDKAKAIDVAIHALNFLKRKGKLFKYIVLLEPTSPLRDASDIDKSIKKILKFKGKSLISVSKCKASHPNFQFRKFNQIIKPINNKKLLRSSRQELKDVFFIDGTIYISKVNHLYKNRAFYSNRTIFFEVPKWKSIEIDDHVDLTIAENLRRNINKLKNL